LERLALEHNNARLLFKLEYDGLDRINKIN